MRDHFELARSVLEETIRLRRIFHQNPELSGCEKETMALISRELEQLNIPYEVFSNGGISATIGSGDRAVGIRGDVDALPIQEKTGLPYASKNDGVMHACGHDVHGALLLGMARIFKVCEKELPCAVKLFFQPAEETIGGAKTMIDEGCMSNPPVDAVLGIHVDPAAPLGAVSFLPGKMNAAVINLSMTVRGQACHGAHPEEGVDSIVVAAHLITALQTVSSRLHAPTTPVIVTIGTIQGGTASNVVAGEVKMTGTVRVLDMEIGRQVKEQICAIAAGVAAAWGAEVDVTLTDDYPALINDAAVSKVVAETAAELLGADKVLFRDTPSLGADDFAYFGSAAKGCYFNIGTTEPGSEPQVLHSETFAPSEDCILPSLALLSACAWKLMEKKP